MRLRRLFSNGTLFLCLVFATETGLAQKSIDFRQAASQAIPATVSITIVAEDQPVWKTDGTGFNGRVVDSWIRSGLGTEQSGVRSGFAVAADRIVTMNLPDQDSVQVRVGAKTVSGAVAVRDQVTGLALVEVEAGDLSSIVIAQDAPQPGQPIAITSMGDRTSAQIRAGMVATRPVAEEAIRGFVQRLDFDAEHADAGAPIVDDQGRLVGVLSFASDGQPISLPVAHVVRLIESADADEPSDLLRGRLGIELGKSDWAAVTGVVPGLPGEKAGLVVGDRVLRVGEIETETQNDVLAAVAMSRAGDSLTLVIEREGESQEMTVTLADFSQRGDPWAWNSSQPKVARRAFRIEDGKLIPVTPDGDDSDAEDIIDWQQLVVPFDAKSNRTIRRLHVERTDLEDALRELEIEKKAHDAKIRELTEQLRSLQPDRQEDSTDSELKRLSEMIEKINRKLDQAVEALEPNEE